MKKIVTRGVHGGIRPLRVLFHSLGIPSYKSQLHGVEAFGGCMNKAVVVFVAALLCLGCGKETVSSPDEVISSGTVIDGFGGEPVTLTSAKVVRVGTYYDFSIYDSLQITFSATRLSTERPFDEILVKIGPTTYLWDTLYTEQENVSLGIRVSRLAKPNFAALVFLTLDPLTILRLSDLRVVGWSDPTSH